MNSRSAILIAGLLAVSIIAVAQPPHAKAHGKGKQEKYHKHGPWNEQHTHPSHRNYSARQLFYYYPTARVYYHPGKRKYACYSNGGWIWMTGIPSGLVLKAAPRYEVYYPGIEVWEDQPVHIRQYGRPSIQVQVNL